MQYSKIELARANRYSKACFAISDEQMTNPKALKVGKDAVQIFINYSRNCKDPLEKQQLIKKAMELLKRVEAIKRAIKKAIDAAVSKKGYDYIGSEPQTRCPLTLQHDCYFIYFKYGRDLEKLGSKEPGYFKAAKQAYIIAATNLNQIQELYELNNSKVIKQIFIRNLILSAEALSPHIKQYPEIQLVLGKYTQRERLIIDIGSDFNAIKYDIWCPSSGIVKRPGQIYIPASAIQVSGDIIGFQVQQHQVGDCSVVSSLACLAHYQMRTGYKDRIISSKIFPQDNQGMPIVNPSGKYVVKLFINGIWRKVIVDDLFPTMKNGKMICASSSKKRLWISILEKAYIKVHGGYNFMGSNSCKDVYAFTGWLPERIKLKQFDESKAWDKIMRGLKNNLCVVTIGTGLIQDEDTIGLISNHAYGIFEVIQVENKRILMVKNPWAHFSWKGKYSKDDKINWTEDLKKKLHYEDMTSKDMGMFWIDWENVCKFFDHLYISWKPNSLLDKTVFDYWKKQEIGKDQVSLINNPQYSLRFPPFSNDGKVWIVFTYVKKPQHQTYIALHIYPQTRGHQRMTIQSRNAIKRSYYTNERVQIMKLEIKPDMNAFNLVLSADQESKQDLYFSIRVFSNIDNFDFVKADIGYSENQSIAVSNDKGGGGNPSCSEFYMNPQYIMELNPKTLLPRDRLSLHPILITFQSADAQTPVAVFLVDKVNPGNQLFSHLKYDMIMNRKEGKKIFDYYPGFSFAQTQIQGDKRYTLIVSTMKPKQLMQGTLKFRSNKQTIIRKIKDETSEMQIYTMMGSWQQSCSGGSFKSLYYTQNPIFALQPKFNSQIRIRLQIISEISSNGQEVKESFQQSTNLALFRLEFAYPPQKGSLNLKGIAKPLLSTNKGVYTNSQSSLYSQKVKLQGGKTYVLIPSKYNQGQCGQFKIVIHSSGALNFMRYLH